MFVVFDKKTPLATLAPAHDTRECIGVVRKYIKELEQKAINPAWDRKIHQAKNWCALHDYFEIKTKQGTSIIVKKIKTAQD